MAYHGLFVRQSALDGDNVKRTSSLLLCFCRLADIVEVPDISLAAVLLATDSNFGRGIDEGESVKGS